MTTDLRILLITRNLPPLVGGMERLNCRQVAELPSSLRAVRAAKFREFLHLLPNGFSYPTTSTMAFFRSTYPVAYVPIPVHARIGKSHIRPIQDGIRFLLIIFKIATLYTPLKLFAPTGFEFFVLGVGITAGRTRPGNSSPT